jgi:hypothetical protein
MKILVTGGRDFDDYEMLKTVLDGLHKENPIDTLIHGGARGADSLADKWARDNNIHISIHLAKWDKYGRSAGPIRNREMLEEKPDLVMAFPGGRGTADMIRQAERAGIGVIRAARYENGVEMKYAEHGKIDNNSNHVEE